MRKTKSVPTVQDATSKRYNGVWVALIMIMLLFIFGIVPYASHKVVRALDSLTPEKKAELIQETTERALDTAVMLFQTTGVFSTNSVSTDEILRWHFQQVDKHIAAVEAILESRGITNSVSLNYKQ